MHTPIHTLTKNTYTLNIYYDTYPVNPREDFDHLGTMVCHHSRYKLGDNQTDTLSDLWLEHATKEELRQYILDQCKNDIPAYRRLLAYYYSSDVHSMFTELPAPTTPPNSIYLLPLYLYDHSGITISTIPFSCRWDSGQIGFIYCTQKRALEYLGDSYADTVYEALKQEVKEYDQYLTGDVYYYTITDSDNEVIDSCSGYYGLDYCKEVAESQLDYFANQYSEAAINYCI